MFHDVLSWDVDRNALSASSVNQATNLTSYATPFAVYYDGIVVTEDWDEQSGAQEDKIRIPKQPCNVFSFNFIETDEISKFVKKP